MQQRARAVRAGRARRRRWGPAGLGRGLGEVGSCAENVGDWGAGGGKGGWPGPSGGIHGRGEAPRMRTGGSESGKMLWRRHPF